MSDSVQFFGWLALAAVIFQIVFLLVQGITFRLLRLPIEAVMFGGGPVILRVPVGSTELRLGLIPFGGYVQTHEAFLEETGGFGHYMMAFGPPFVILLGLLAALGPAAMKARVTLILGGIDVFLIPGREGAEAASLAFRAIVRKVPGEGVLLTVIALALMNCIPAVVSYWAQRVTGRRQPIPELLAWLYLFGCTLAFLF